MINYFLNKFIIDNKEFNQTVLKVELMIIIKKLKFFSDCEFIFCFRQKKFNQCLLNQIKYNILNTIHS